MAMYMVFVSCSCRCGGALRAPAGVGPVAVYRKERFCPLRCCGPDELFGIGPVVVEARNLVLAPHFAVGPQPMFEGSRRYDGYFGLGQRGILETLGFVIGVHPFESLVYRLRELWQAGRRSTELYHPFVRAFAASLHVDGSYGIFGHFGPCRRTGVVHGRFGVVYYDFFAESVDVVLGTSRDADGVG